MDKDETRLISAPRQGQATGGEIGQWVMQRGETFDALYCDRAESLDEVIHPIAWMAEQSLAGPPHNTFVTAPALGRS